MTMLPATPSLDTVILHACSAGQPGLHPPRPELGCSLTVPRRLLCSGATPWGRQISLGMLGDPKTCVSRILAMLQACSATTGVLDSHQHCMASSRAPAGAGPGSCTAASVRSRPTCRRC